MRAWTDAEDAAVASTVGDVSVANQNKGTDSDANSVYLSNFFPTDFISD